MIRVRRVQPLRRLHLVCLAAVVGSIPALRASAQTAVIDASAAIMPGSNAPAPAPGTPDQADSNLQVPDLTVRWAPFDLHELTLEDAVRDRVVGEPRRVAASRASPLGRVLNPAQDGQWSRTPDGGDAWRLMIESPGALGVRVEFSQFDLPAGATLALRGSDASSAIQVYTGAGPLNSGTFLSHSVGGEQVFLEYAAPPEILDPPIIEVGEILHIYRSVPDPRGQRADDSEGLEPCHVDASCQNLDRVMRDAVGRMFWRSGGFGFVCTGTLLNDADPSTLTGWFLTANHCIDSQVEAQTLEVFWFYHTSGCDQSAPALFSLPRSIGADFITGSSQTDFTFLMLHEEPRDGQTFAGWTTGNASGAVTAIHHPGGSYRRLTRGTITTQPSPSACLGQQNYLYVRVTQGLTEGGSSGAPLFNDNGQVVGQLFGGCGAPSCSGGNPSDVYGRFSVSYQLGQLGRFLNVTPTDDPFEPNDTPWSAAALSAGTTALLLHDDNDYFSIDISEASRVTVRADFSHSTVDLDLSLMTPGGVQLGSSTGIGNSELVSQLLQPGRYLIRAYRAGGEGGSYTLSIVVQPGNAGDVDGDGDITPADVATLLRLWGRSCAEVQDAECPDYNGSATIDVGDLEFVLRLLGYDREQHTNSRWKKQVKQLLQDDSFRQRAASVARSAQKQWKKILNSSQP